MTLRTAVLLLALYLPSQEIAVERAFELCEHRKVCQQTFVTEGGRKIDMSVSPELGILDISVYDTETDYTFGVPLEYFTKHGRSGHYGDNQKDTYYNYRHIFSGAQFLKGGDIGPGEKDLFYSYLNKALQMIKARLSS